MSCNETDGGARGNSTLFNRMANEAWKARPATFTERIPTLGIIDDYLGTPVLHFAHIIP